MKKILVFLVALAAVFALKTTNLAEAKAKVKVVTRTYTGTILWVDPIRNAIVLKEGEEDVRFKVVTYTKLKRRGKAAHLAKFVKGDKVTITYKLERNTKIATAIY